MGLNNFSSKKMWQQLLILSLMLVAMIISGEVISSETIMNLPLTGDKAYKGWTINKCKATTGADGITLELKKDEMTRGTLGIYRFLPIAKLRGKQVNVSIDVRTKGLTSGPKAKYFHGGKFVLEIKAAGKKMYPGAKIPYGNNDWKRIEFSSKIPADATAAILSLGFQNAYGVLEFRNLKIERIDNSNSETK